MVAQIKIPQTLRYNTLERTLEILSQAFTKDAFQGYFNRTYLGLTRSAPITVEHNRRIFSIMLSQLELEGAHFLTAPGTETVATVWQVKAIPSRPVLGKAHTSMPHALQELYQESMRAFQRILPPGSNALHYALAGNLKSEAGTKSKQKGLSFINKEMFAAASKAGLPIIGECTCVNSRDMSLHHGFEQIEEVRVGRGEANEKGELEDGGAGIPIYLVLKKA